MRPILLLILSAIFAASAFAQPKDTMPIKLYFLNAKLDPDLMDCRAVKPVTRLIPKTKAPATAALNELFKGVNAEEKSRGFVSFSPEETSGILKSVKIKNKAAYVNFDKAVHEKLGSATSSCGGGFFSSIEQTLFQFPLIKKVFYAIEGDPADFYEWVQVGECPPELKNCSGKDF